MRPYLAEFPVPNGEDLGVGLAAYRFPFTQTIDQDYFQARLDQTLGGHDQLFLRYTYDRGEQYLPTVFPQFPRTFVSRNQFATAEYRRVFSARTLGTFRLGYSRTRIGQEVEANTSQPLTPFVPGRESLGAIDIGGVPRFGPQVSADVSIRQDVFAFNGDFLQTRGAALAQGRARIQQKIKGRFGWPYQFVPELCRKDVRNIETYLKISNSIEIQNAPGTTGFPRIANIICALRFSAASSKR